jgi:hypothetical protein
VARIRTIKPEAFSSMSAKRLSMGARVLFPALWTMADDAGRLIGSVRKIAGEAFPFDDDVTEAQVAGWLEELERAGSMVRRYVVAGVAYYCIPSFLDHQRISHPTPSRLPPPPDAPESPEPLAKSSGETPEPLRMDLGRELKGREQGGGSGAVAPPPRVTRTSPKRHQMLAPQSVDELLETPVGEKLKAKFPHLDGKAGRPTLGDVIGAIGWHNVERWSWPTQWESKLNTYVADRGARHRGAWEREQQGGGARAGPGAIDAEAIWANSAAARFGRPLEPEDE